MVPKGGGWVAEANQEEPEEERREHRTDARVNLLTVGVYRDSKIASHAIMLLVGGGGAGGGGGARARTRSSQNSAESAAIITDKRPLLLRVDSSRRLSSVRTCRGTLIGVYATIVRIKVEGTRCPLDNGSNQATKVHLIHTSISLFRCNQSCESTIQKLLVDWNPSLEIGHVSEITIMVRSSSLLRSQTISPFLCPSFPSIRVISY